MKIVPPSYEFELTEKDGQHRLGSKPQFEKRFVKEDPKTKERTIARPAVVKALLTPFVDHFETRDMKQQERMPKKIVEEVSEILSQAKKRCDKPWDFCPRRY